MIMALSTGFHVYEVSGTIDKSDASHLPQRPLGADRGKNEEQQSQDWHGIFEQHFSPSLS
jgi:hypothetical protein